MSQVRLTPLSLLAVAIAAAAFGFGVSDSAAGQPGRLARAGSQGSEVTASGRRSLASRVLRVQNAERRRHGLRRLRISHSLNRAARSHVRDMVRRHYFGHFSRSGRDVVDRVASTRYGRGRWFAAQENLYWWNRRRAAGIVLRAWLGSAVHRANVLNGAFRQFGVAVLMRSPFGHGITVVGVYATHRRR